MATVSVNNGNLQAASQPNLVWSEGWRPPDAKSAFIKQTELTLVLAIATDDGMAVASAGPCAGHFHLTPNR